MQQLFPLLYETKQHAPLNLHVHVHTSTLTNKLARTPSDDSIHVNLNQLGRCEQRREREEKKWESESKFKVYLTYVPYD